MKLLLFNLLTVADTKTGRDIYSLGTGKHALDDKSTAKAMFHLHQQKTGLRELPLFLQRIVVISVILVDLTADKSSLGRIVLNQSLNAAADDEVGLLSQLGDVIQSSRPQLISWQGSEFDWPLVQYRCLKHGLISPFVNYDKEQLLGPSNNYINLKKCLSGWLDNDGPTLNEAAKLIGLSDPVTMSQSRIWKRYLKNDHESLRRDNEQRTRTIYRVLLRYLLTRNELSRDSYKAAMKLIEHQ